MSKAFTLIEMLAVILILSIILGIAVPRVLSAINSSKNNAYNVTVKGIEKAAADYVTENANLYTNQNNFQITIDTLCNNGYVNCPVYNPSTNAQMSGYVNVTMNTKGSFDYKYIEQ